MLVWLSANVINITLAAVIVLIAGLAIRSMIRDKRAGKSSCGGKCADCGACSACGKGCMISDRADAVAGNTAK